MVRKAVNNDISRINELGNQLNEKFSKLFNVETILNEQYSKIFVFEEENVIKGFLHVTELYETVDIINIVVDSKYRNKGIATILMDYMIDDANKQVNTFTLEVNVNNENAIKLYENFGFEIINTRKSYYNNEDAYLMAKVVK